MRADQLSPEAHLLVVEDDGEMRNLITKFLRQNGFRVTGARDGREMWDVLGSAPVDLILLDVMLPGQSGLDLCRALRAKSGVPIIMVTARGEEADRVLGLELGADDYIPKPFGRAELLARVRALLRRSSGAAGEPVAGTTGGTITFGGWSLDARRRELASPDGVAVDLSGGEYDLLLAFCEHAQRVLSRDQLLDLARNRHAFNGTDRSVDVMVSRLRRKLEPTDESPTVIKTIRGAGYMLVPAVKRGV
ncbi:response regulator transcription factor [Roseomonas sp. F4]|uniref:Response regulator transcription factor n=2 Tax=Falsiroseomonas TaxID=2870713 RepID=A0ABS6HHR5_9PROT|nr:MULTISPECIES: response regulator transcription factor [Acetobacteraceae]MBU8547208.1 response regulator transcription factor [Roseomonas oleicola]NKE45277.1 response regulator transcription factor [Falsiroseomonas frigidaquae]